VFPESDTPESYGLLEVIMQKFLYQMKEDDRRTARKWSAASFCFYGSIVAGLALYVVLHMNPNTEYASVGEKSQTQTMLTKR
jgi:hypothetical protein